MTKFNVVLINPKGWRLTTCPKYTEKQPYDQAQEEINNHPQHKDYGPWKAIWTYRV